jgi:hypothetical protein
MRSFFFGRFLFYSVLACDVRVVQRQEGQSLLRHSAVRCTGEDTAGWALRMSLQEHVQASKSPGGAGLDLHRVTLSVDDLLDRRRVEALRPTGNGMSRIANSRREPAAMMWRSGHSSWKYRSDMIVRGRLWISSRKSRSLPGTILLFWRTSNSGWPDVALCTLPFTSSGTLSD